jgi:hypothetical protein
MVDQTQNESRMASTIGNVVPSKFEFTAERIVAQASKPSGPIEPSGSLLGSGRDGEQLDGGICYKCRQPSTFSCSRCKLVKVSQAQSNASALPTTSALTERPEITIQLNTQHEQKVQRNANHFGDSSTAPSRASLLIGVPIKDSANIL